MAYRVDLTTRAIRDLGRIYRTIDAVSSDQAHTWFSALERAILSLDENPARGAVIHEGGGIRHLLHGRGRNIYRILYAIDDQGGVVTVLHIRHGARDAFVMDRPRHLA